MAVRTSCQAASPTRSSVAVESTMSVKRTVARTRSPGPSGTTPKDRALVHSTVTHGHLRRPMRRDPTGSRRPTRARCRAWPSSITTCIIPEIGTQMMQLAGRRPGDRGMSVVHRQPGSYIARPTGLVEDDDLGASVRERPNLVGRREASGLQAGHATILHRSARVQVSPDPSEHVLPGSQFVSVERRCHRVSHSGRRPTAIGRSQAAAEGQVDHDVRGPDQRTDEPERREEPRRGEPEHHQRRHRVMQGVEERHGAGRHLPWAVRLADPEQGREVRNDPEDEDRPARRRVAPIARSRRPRWRDRGRARGAGGEAADRSLGDRAPQPVGGLGRRRSCLDAPPDAGSRTTTAVCARSPGGEAVDVVAPARVVAERRPTADHVPRRPRREPGRPASRRGARPSCRAAPGGSATRRAPSRPSRSWPG